jgi:hypothetical protein
MITRLVVLLSALVSQLAAAQGWVTDPNAQRLAWGTSNVVLQSDTATGVQLWAVTSQVLRHDTPRRAFAARFDPDSVVIWLATAEKLLEGARPPKDPTTSLQTPILFALDSSQLSLQRYQENGGWSSHVRIAFTAPDGNAPWAISAEVRETSAFLKALFRSAALSSYRPDVNQPLAPNPADTSTCPSALTQPVVNYPAARVRAGSAGEVWLTYVVRTDSTVDRTSVRVLFSDGVEFTAAAVRAITSVRYRPATRAGEPHDALAYQRVSFVLKD